MKKRLLSILLILCMSMTMLSGLTLSASATSGSCGESLTWALNDAGKLTISGEGAMTEFIYREVPWYDLKSEIKVVEMEDGVTTIGRYAFSSCDGLISVIIPDSVTMIGEGAFRDCDRLVSVTIPSSVTTIEDYAFWNCDQLASVTLSDGVKKIGTATFTQCDRLKSVTIPDSVTVIGERAFDSCSSLSSIMIPDSVTSIGTRAFSSCDSLTDITVDPKNPNYSSLDGNLYNKEKTILIQYAPGKSGAFIIPDSVTTIGSSAFYYCSSLTSVRIPASVITIGWWALENCDALIEIVVNENNPKFSSLNGNLYDKEQTKLIQYAIGKKQTEFTAPAEVTTIGARAFYGCERLIGVNLLKDVTVVEDYAFACCDSLEYMKFGISMTEIGGFALGSNETLLDVYYSGRKEEWKSIRIFVGNDALLNAKIHFNYDPSAIRVGDISGDENVDISDAVMLFQHSMLPDLYPIEYAGSVDFNKDGVVDISDAVLLFQHSMLPDLYPIE